MTPFSNHIAFRDITFTMRSLLLAACLVWFLACATFATTVIPFLQNCPACEREFLSREFGSWFQWNEPERDFRGGLFHAALDVTTCPYCLYTAVGMDPVSTAARDRLRIALNRLPAGLSKPAKTKRSASNRSADVIEKRVQLHLARLCNAQLEPDRKREVNLALAGYYRSEEGSERTAATRRAIDALQTATNEKSFARERSDLVYLLGELQRRTGNTKQAAATLTVAASLAEKDGEIRRWALEQRSLAKRGVSSVAGSPRSSDDYEIKRIEEFRRRLPAFIKALQGGRPGEEWLLPRKGSRAPTNDSLGAANKLAMQGDRLAVEYVLRWLAELETKRIKDYPEPYCIEAVAHQPTFAEAILPRLSFRSDRMAEAVRYACGLIPAPKTTINALRGRAKWLPTDSGVLKAATVRRDPVFKDVLLSNAVSARCWSAASPESYLRAVATAADIPILERRARSTRHPRDVSEYDPRTSQREDLEDILLHVRLAALARSLE
jgi:Uncharacterized protein conserved in bacteria (DUF2225)